MLVSSRGRRRWSRRRCAWSRPPTTKAKSSRGCAPASPTARSCPVRRLLRPPGQPGQPPHRDRQARQRPRRRRGQGGGGRRASSYSYAGERRLKGFDSRKLWVRTARGSRRRFLVAGRMCTSEGLREGWVPLTFGWAIRPQDSSARPRASARGAWLNRTLDYRRSTVDEGSGPRSGRTNDRFLARGPSRQLHGGPLCREVRHPPYRADVSDRRCASNGASEGVHRRLAQRVPGCPALPTRPEPGFSPLRLRYRWRASAIYTQRHANSDVIRHRPRDSTDSAVTHSRGSPTISDMSRSSPASSPGDRGG